MAMRNDWDTDSFGDPTAGNPWDGSAAATPTTPTPAAPDPSWNTPQASAPAAAPAAPASDTYDSHLSSISQAADPASQATAQDGLARQVQADLEADGHSVKWVDGTTLSVDGRSYELGDGGGQGITDPGVVSAQPAATGYPGGIPQDATGNQVGSGIPWNPGEDHPSYDPAGYHWDSTYAMEVPNSDSTSPKIPTGMPTGGALSDPTFAAQLVAWAGNLPGVNPSVKNDPSYWIGRFTSGAFGNDQDYALKRMMTPEGAPEGSTSTSGAGQTSPWLQQPARSTPTYPAWSPSAPTYTPNFIDPSASELPGFKDVLDLLSTPGAGDAELQQLVQSIVEHPETLTDQDIEMLKSRSAEEAAVAGQSQDEELKHFGYNTGLDTSPWLAGQRAQNAWNRSNSTIGANRSIDIAAASTRQADRQQAATIGTAYSSFQSSKKSQAVGLAVQAALGKAGEQRSRTQLNESLKQAATQLGLTKDNLVMTYLSHAMTDATNNKQLDLNFDVDMKKLAEQSDEFKQTLLQRMHELSQADDQFRANYGLAAQEFQHKKDQDAWDRAKSTAA